MILNTLIIGNGPDTYPMHFPQHDFEGKKEFLQSEDKLVDKPHSLYLQLAISSGLPSLLAFMALIGLYVASSFQVYRNLKETDSLFGIGVGIFFGMMGYLVTMLFNDSIVSVAPVFWVLLGMGFAINTELYRDKMNDSESRVKVI
jgi:O-antigen ligase